MVKVEHICSIVEIADAGSLSQAARNLFASQPNLSRVVKEVEQEVGFRLFDRTASGVIPTSQGRQLIDHFRIIKNVLGETDRVIYSITHNPRVSLRVAAMDFDRSIPAFSSLINQYINSPIDFSFRQVSSMDRLLEMVETSQVDFAIVGTLSPSLKKTLRRFEDASVEYHKLCEVPLCALVGPQNPLYHGPDRLPMSALYPYTIVQNGSAAEDPSRSLPYVTGLSALAFGEISVNSSHLFYKTIQMTPAVGIIAYTPQLLLEQSPWSDIRIIQFSDCEITAQFGWVKLRRVPMNDLAKELCQAVVGLY